MQIPQSTTPQKTSFWDFRHKKVYLSRKEKLIDLFFGMFGIPIIVYLFCCVFTIFVIFLGIAPQHGSESGIVRFFLTPLYSSDWLLYPHFFPVYLLILIYSGLKRRYIFWGFIIFLLLLGILLTFLLITNVLDISI